MYLKYYVKRMTELKTKKDWTGMCAVSDSQYSWSRREHRAIAQRVVEVEFFWEHVDEWLEELAKSADQSALLMPQDDNTALEALEKELAEASETVAQDLREGDDVEGGEEDEQDA